MKWEGIIMKRKDRFQCFLLFLSVVSSGDAFRIRGYIILINFNGLHVGKQVKGHTKKCLVISSLKSRELPFKGC